MQGNAFTAKPIEQLERHTRENIKRGRTVDTAWEKSSVTCYKWKALDLGHAVFYKTHLSLFEGVGQGRISQNHSQTHVPRTHQRCQLGGAASGASATSLNKEADRPMLVRHDRLNELPESTSLWNSTGFTFDFTAGSFSSWNWRRSRESYAVLVKNTASGVGHLRVHLYSIPQTTYLLHCQVSCYLRREGASAMLLADGVRAHQERLSFMASCTIVSTSILLLARERPPAPSKTV